MATVKLPYIDRFRDPRGIWRYYFRKARGSKRIPLPGRPGEPDFMRAYEIACTASGSAKPPNSLAAATGSFDALAAAYYRSASFAMLSINTQRTYNGIIERFRSTEGKNGRSYGANRVATLERRHVNEIITEKMRSSGPSAANNLLKVLRALLAFAVDNNWRASDPTIGIKPIQTKTDGFKTWEDSHIKIFEECYATGTRERLALSLLLYTAQRRGDVVEMGRQHIRGDTIRVTQKKTGVSLVIPMHPKLVAEIESSAASSNMTFLLTAYGRPFTPAGFGNWFRDACDAAGLKELSAHGLRKAAARRLAEAGCSPHQIQALTGHKTLKEVSRYTAAADQERMARDAMKRIEES